MCDVCVQRKNRMENTNELHIIRSVTAVCMHACVRV